jgi:hypothetical protein
MWNGHSVDPLRWLGMLDDPNVRSISRDWEAVPALGDHLEGNSEGQDGARGSSPGLATASESWCFGWSGHVLAGRGAPEGFMQEVRAGVVADLAKEAALRRGWSGAVCGWPGSERSRT